MNKFCIPENSSIGPVFQFWISHGIPALYCSPHKKQYTLSMYCCILREESPYEFSHLRRIKKIRSKCRIWTFRTPTNSRWTSEENLFQQNTEYFGWRVPIKSGLIMMIQNWPGNFYLGQDRENLSWFDSFLSEMVGKEIPKNFNLIWNLSHTILQMDRYQKTKKLAFKQ